MSKAKHTPGPWSIDAKDMQQDDDTVFSLGVWAGEGDNSTMVTCVSAFGLRSETNGDTKCVFATAPAQSELDEAKANAHLIAAAPLMLDALKDAEHRMRSQLILLKCDDEFIAHETETVRAAIAAATGESNG